MLIRSGIVGAALVAMLAEGVFAQSVVRMVGSDLKHAAQDFAAVWTSPLRGSTKDYLIAAGVVAAGAATSPFDDDADRWAIRNRDRGFLDAIRPFRRGGRFYSINDLTPYVAGLYVVGVATKHTGIRDGIFGCLAAYGANTTIRHQVVYRIVGRDRPETSKDLDPGVAPTPPAEQGDQYDFNVPADGWGQHSFPGGHVATMTTCASFLGHRFKLGPVEPVLAGLVAVMAVGRLADRGHWLSDQVVGSAFGFAVGREVARRQLKRRSAAGTTASGADAESGVKGEPYVRRDADAVRVGWQVVF
jgi:membrane-associated phospholipid phosphatase